MFKSTLTIQSKTERRIKKKMKKMNAVPEDQRRTNIAAIFKKKKKKQRGPGYLKSDQLDTN